MVNKLTEALTTLIKDKANDNPAPKVCTIKSVYDDGHVDVNLMVGDSEGVIPYRPYIGNPIVGDEAVIVFINGSENKGYVLCDNNVLEEVNNVFLGMLNYNDCEGV